MSEPQIKYDIAANVSGGEQIERLATELGDLKNSVDKSSAAAATLGVLGKELEKLGEQQAAIEKFKALKAAVDDADTSFHAAQIIAQGLGAELSKTTTVTAAQRGEFERARDEVKATKQAWQDSVTALTGMRTELAASGVNTKNLATEQINLNTQVSGTARQLTELKTSLGTFAGALAGTKTNTEQTGAALEQAFKVLGVRSVQAIEAEIAKLREAMLVIRNSGSFMSPDSLKAAENLQAKIATLNNELKGVVPAATPAAGAVKQVGSASGTAAESIASAGVKVGAMVAAFAGINSLGDVAKNVITTGASFETLRVRLEQLLGSQQKSVAAFDMIKQLAITTPFEVTALTESFAKLTSYGLQPNVTQMRALADTAAAAGGGQEMLQRVSLALGQAWAKQKLQGGEILQLTEAGVPVWDLLAKATGKNVTELMKLSEAGALGRDVITKLFDALGEKNAGASERLMHTFAGTVSNAKDALAEFFDMVSRSGLLDYLTQQIQAVLTEFDRLKNNGELERKAKAISDAVIAMADTLKGAVAVVSQFSGAITHLIEAMVISRIATFGASLVTLGVQSVTATRNMAGAAASASALGASAGAASAGVGLFGRAVAMLAGGVVVTAVVTAVGFLVDRFMAAKRAADDGDAAVAAMLNEKGTGAAAKAIKDTADAANAGEKEVKLLKNGLDNVVGEALLAKLKEFREKLSEIKPATKVAQDGFVAIGLQAAKSLGVDTNAAINKVEDSFKGSNASLTVLIQTLPNLAKEGYNTGALVGEAMKNMINSAKTQAEIDIITKRLTELGQRGYQSGNQVADGMELAKRKGEDLKQGIATWGLGFDNVAAQAKKAGIDIGELTTGISKKFRDGLTDIDNVAAAIKVTGADAKTAGVELSKALDQQLSAAKTKEEIKALIVVLKNMGNQGVITGDQLKDALDKANGKLDDMTKGVNSLAEAYKQLGIQSPQEVAKIAEANKAAWDKISKDSSAGTDTLKLAFAKYAQTAIAAANDIGNGQGEVTKRILETEAAANGLSITFDATGKIIVKTQKEAQDELNKTKNAVDGVTGALEKQNAEIERGIAAQEKAVQLEERKKALQDKANRVDAEGFQIDNAGNRLTVNTQTDRSVYENAKRQGLSEAQALQISNQFIQNGQMVGGSGTNSYAGETWYTELQKAIDKIVLDNARAAAKGSASTTGSAAGSTSSSATQNHTYTVNIPNYGSVNVASANDASSLTNIIDQLARAKAAAGV